MGAEGAARNRRRITKVLLASQVETRIEESPTRA